MPNQISRKELLNWWLKKYHDTDVNEILEKYPEECKDPRWFKMFPVTKKQHDEWYDWAISMMSKKLKISKHLVKRKFAFDYLDCAPYYNVDE